MAVLAVGMAMMAAGALPGAQSSALAQETQPSQPQTAQPGPAPHPGQPQAASSPVNSLRPALGEVQSAVESINIDRWKLSHGWKNQLQSDANSIMQDITSTLPGLLQSAQAAPLSLAPQLSVMHNVDALYDVLVRLTTASSFGGRKDEATALADALRELEAVRKSASAQVLSAATQQDAEIAKVREEIRRAAAGPQPGSQLKTIIVDNDVKHHRKRRKVTHKKEAPAPATNSANPGTPQ